MREYRNLREAVSQILDEYEMEIWSAALHHEDKLRAIRSDLRDILKESEIDRTKVQQLLEAI